MAMIARRTAPSHVLARTCRRFLIAKRARDRLLAAYREAARNLQTTDAALDALSDRIGAATHPLALVERDLADILLGDSAEPAAAVVGRTLLIAIPADPDGNALNEPWILALPAARIRGLGDRQGLDDED